MKRLISLALAIGLGLASLVPAMAQSDTGSHGWALVDLT